MFAQRRFCVSHSSQAHGYSSRGVAGEAGHYSDDVNLQFAVVRTRWIFGPYSDCFWLTFYLLHLRGRLSIVVDNYNLVLSGPLATELGSDVAALPL